MLLVVFGASCGAWWLVPLDQTSGFLQHKNHNEFVIEGFDAQALHEAFRIAIQDLSAMQEKQKIKCQALEQVCLLFIFFLVCKSYCVNSYLYFYTIHMSLKKF